MKKITTILMSIFMVAFMMSGVWAQTESESNADANLSAVFESSDSKRSLPNAVLPGFTSGPSYFSDAPMTHEYMGIADLARINNEWTDVNVKYWANEEDAENIEVDERIIREYHSPSSKFKIVLANPQDRNGIEFIGTVVAHARSNTSTEAVFGKLASICIDNGANLMYPVNEGAQKVLSANAFGLAFGYSHVVMGGGSERTAGAGTAGIGKSWGESKYSHQPFARVALYKVKDDVYKEINTFPKNGYDSVKQENINLRNHIKNLQQRVEQYQQENQ